MQKILIYQSVQELIKSAANEFISIGSEAIKTRGIYTVALSGGGTPQPLYKALADQYFDDLDWSKVHFFWGDERSVPPDHDDSNFNQANRSLLLPLSVPVQNIHRVQAQLPPEEAARKYEKELRSVFPAHPPSFDLILLGMGDDGHTASLFPGTELVMKDRDHQTKLVAANYVPQLETWRITFTKYLINAAHNVIFLVNGKNKARILKMVLEGPSNPEELPSQLIDPKSGNLVWLIDHDAAADLSENN